MRLRKHSGDTRNREALWLDAKGVKNRFSIHRTTLRRMETAGEIRSVSLREPGSRRGKRLYEVASIERLLERRGGSPLVTDQEACEAMTRMQSGSTSGSKKGGLP